MRPLSHGLTIRHILAAGRSGCSVRGDLRTRSPTMKAGDHVVLAHHKPAATMWGRGGKAYDEVSFAISDALAHAAQRLNARAGERILDVATGTGWSARNVARAGAFVTAVDISPELLAAAADISAQIRPPIEFQLADVEQLQFEDGIFDGVISTFGVMFHQSGSRRRGVGACMPLGRSPNPGNMGTRRRSGGILRGHCQIDVTLSRRGCM